MKKLMVVVCFLSLILQAAPEESAVSIGAYFLGQLPVRTADPMGYAANQIRALGGGPARTAISPTWDPQPELFVETGGLDFRPLWVKMYRPEYFGFLTAFDTVAITSYDAASHKDGIRGEKRFRNRELYSDEQWEAYLTEVREEFRRYSFELMKLSAQFGTRYIVLNWEAAHDCNRRQEWPACLEYYQARLDGIGAGRQQALAMGVNGRVLCGYEFVFLRDGVGPDHSPDSADQVSDFLKGLKNLRGVDLWSYSSWNSIVVSDKATVAQDNAQSFHQAFSDIRNACKEQAVDCHIMIGEVGYLYDRTEFRLALTSILETILAEKAALVFTWTLYDDPTQVFGPRDLSHFGSFTPEGNITPHGEILQEMNRKTAKR